MEVAEPMFPSTYRSLPENWNAEFMPDDVTAPITTSMFWFCPSIKRFDEALTPESEKKIGLVVVAVPPITMSLVEVLFLTTSVGPS